MNITAYNTNVFQKNSEKTKEPSATQEGNVIDGWFENSKDSGLVNVDMFLQLMIAQLKNQDFTNPVDDTAYVTQLAQFATMQQMQELSYYSKSNYVMSLVGKEVTAAKMAIGGKVENISGTVTKIGLVAGQFSVYINDQMFTLDQIMEIKPLGSTSKPESKPETNPKPEVGKDEENL